MNKKNLVTQYVESTKHFISSNCNSLKEYLLKKNMEWKDKRYGSEFMTSCTKCMFILLNVFYLLTALLILTAGTIWINLSKFASLFYFLPFESKLISISWIMSGEILLIVSIFGIVGACKNSVAWTNIYGVLMIVAFIVQLPTSMVGFMLVSKLELIVRHTLDRLIENYKFSEPPTITMDFIQKSLQCCGNEAPTNWERNMRYESEDGSRYLSTLYIARTPESCCAPESGYQNLTCDIFFRKGCLDKTYEMTLQLIFTINSVALAVAVVQIVGILTAFIYAKMIRRTKSYKAAHHTLNWLSDEIINGTTFVDYTHLDVNDKGLI